MSKSQARVEAPSRREIAEIDSMLAAREEFGRQHGLLPESDIGRIALERRRARLVQEMSAVKAQETSDQDPGLSCEGRDIVEQLNYVASQMPGATRNRNWGVVHARVLEEAAREIRRLRSVIYDPPGVAPLLYP